jgi:ribosomal protein S18 acetylase RimI-like enzyme
VLRCLDELAGRGFATVITSALPPRERQVFVTVGFEEQDRLHLLTHDLHHLPPASANGPRIRKARRTDRAGALAVDAATFTSFWRLDDLGLDQAIEATTSARFRVAVDPTATDDVIGYAITGRDGRQGYMQRLAVLPPNQRAGVGGALALDGLRWLRRRGAERALVNTQVGNDAAFSLYCRLGFRLDPSDLAVLRRDLAR